MTQGPIAPVKAKLLRESGQGMVTTTGGPFKNPQTMEWQLVDASGEALGVTCSEKMATAINRLAELHQLLLDINAIKHLKQRFDLGYLEIPVDVFKRLETLLTAQAPNG